ncbi:hydrolase [Vibrio sp. 10N.286.49.C2]|uniref:NlpC/P60 family protein n=1 Tax=unclassified Vibrio TaxID=2614977 RepID=UPI000C837A07|nr:MULTISPECIES: NlpC/P60 family protein [unclassified Vibrio]PMH37241.1 hydrolase [Vibrio sp. 10N.286.49.C2]PMH57386.1 hydrolase [Vibrio sp. 10N.286.49.B1]PMH82145.1 hydrolase [Vibrio sp. 10N.286.48.B7]
MKIHKLLICCSIVAALSACSSSPERPAHTQQSYNSPNNAPFLAEYKKWQGVPYRLGGTNYSGVDCSAFVQAVYKDAYSVSLPRTTAQQINIGSKVGYNDAKSGDLVFFKTGYKTRHVGIYLGGNTFMHASTSKGVIMSRLDNPYWASTFWHFRSVN